MKRILVILWYAIILVGVSMPFWNKEYTHPYYGNKVENIKVDFHFKAGTDCLHHKCYQFDYTNKYGIRKHAGPFNVYDNIEWFESELKKGNYYDSSAFWWYYFVCVFCYTIFFFIGIQYIFYFTDRSYSISHCEGCCPLKPICPYNQQCQNALINSDFIFSDFYKWFGKQFISFCGY